MTPTWQSDDGRVQLWHGDCLDIIRTLPANDQSDWCLVSDVPYGIGYTHSGKGNGKHNRRNIRPIFGDDRTFNPKPWIHFPIVVFVGADHFAQLLPWNGRWLIWDKLAMVRSFDSFSDAEIAWCNKPGAVRIFRYLWKGICQQGDKQVGRLHPSQKPTELMEWLMDQAGIAQTATVLDPFMGSGTTGIACIRTGRRFIGIEIDKHYFNVAKDRIQNELRQQLLPI